MRPEFVFGRDSLGPWGVEQLTKLMSSQDHGAGGRGAVWMQREVIRPALICVCL